MSTQCEHGRLARQCGYCERDAEIEWLRADTKTLREAVVSAAHTLEQARIWDGMKWHWNINANACKRAWKILDAALAAEGE